MSRITVQRPAARYTMIPNSVIRERKLSLRAVGLYCQLASLPPNATTSIRQLAEQHKEGKHAIQAAKDELIAAGLLTVEQVRNGGRFDDAVWRLTAQPKPAPCTDFRDAVNRDAASPCTDLPDTVLPAPVNRYTYKTLQDIRREGDKSPDPLCGFAELQSAFPEIEAMLRAAHPKAKPLGDADRDALAKLTRIDRYPEREVVEALRWLFEAAHPDAEFWRAQVYALGPLRKGKDGATKFARIHEAWKRAAAGAKAARVQLPEHLRQPPRRMSAGDTP